QKRAISARVYRYGPSFLFEVPRWDIVGFRKSSFSKKVSYFIKLRKSDHFSAPPLRPAAGEHRFPRSARFPGNSRARGRKPHPQCAAKRTVRDSPGGGGAIAAYISPAPAGY